jgi:hypothetical protein
MNSKPVRPQSLESALGFLGEPEATQLKTYIKSLEEDLTSARQLVKRLYKAGCIKPAPYGYDLQVLLDLENWCRNGMAGPLPPLPLANPPEFDLPTNLPKLRRGDYIMLKSGTLLKVRHIRVTDGGRNNEIKDYWWHLIVTWCDEVGQFEGGDERISYNINGENAGSPRKSDLLCILPYSYVLGTPIIGPRQQRYV